MQPIINFIKKETVLTISWVLAIISAFIIHPSIKYIDYIDFKSLGTLWSLMVIMEGLKSLGLFKAVGLSLLEKTGKVWQLASVLVFLCFFFSMFITNDVALLTFVPFSIFMLEMCNKTNLLIPVIVLQTLAANLGSMLTPIGNPQNLYLYGISEMPITDFISLMFPLTAITAVLLVLSIALIKGKNDDIMVNSTSDTRTPLFNSGKKKATCIIYILLFVISLLTVARIIPFYLLVICVFITCIIIDQKSIINIDYALLLTFVGFFIFTGNLGNIGPVKSLFTNFVGGHEMLAGILTSQFISNVPAALLLSEFATSINNLILGVNLGGLGTLIASMASLISFKLLAHSHNDLKGRYFIHFTIMNVIYLIILVLCAQLFVF